MKHLFIIFFFSFHASLLYGQTPESRETDLSIQTVFENFNTELVNLGYLSDFSLNFNKGNKYNGNEMNENNFSSASTFLSIYSNLSASAIHPSFHLPHPNTFFESIRPNNDTVLIKTIFFDYNQIKASAVVDSEVVIVDNRINNVLGKNPFEVKTLFISAPWINSSAHNNAVIFKFDEPVTNRADILNFEIDFGDNQGYIPVEFRSNHLINYQDSSDNEVKIRLTTIGNEVFYSHFKLKIEKTIFPDRGYQSNSVITGINGATVTLLPSCDDNILCNPLIVIEGFNGPIIGDTKYFSFRNYITDFNNFALNSTVRQQLESGGYDIVYVDFINGSDALNNNAEIVKSVIRKVNELKNEAGCNQKNMIWGESMGGVISKLALREMEVNGENHDCEKLISFDSPLRGANFPLGYQYMVEHFANVVVGGVNPPNPPILLRNIIAPLGDAFDMLTSPAAKEMLIYHFQDWPSKAPEHIQLYDQMRSLGELQNCEHIAISNGSQIGNGQGFGNNARMLKINGDISDILSQCANINTPMIPDLLEIFANIFLNTDVEVDFECRALPGVTDPEALVYSGEAKVKILGIPVVNLPSVIKTVVGTQPLDNCPGGNIDFSDALPTTLPCGNIISVDQTRFCFIPSVSAIEVGPFVGGNQPYSNVNADISLNPAVLASGLTTVDRFVAEDEAMDPTIFNHPHLDFTFENSSVLLYELREMGQPNNPLNDRTYNFGNAENIIIDYSQPIPLPFPHGQTSRVINKNLDILNSGKLWVNKVDKIGYVDVLTNPLVLSPSEFDLHISQNCGSTTTVSAYKNGEITIGEKTPTLLNKSNIGRLIVDADNQLIVGDGGVLIIDEKSNLIANSQGSIHVLSGGKIHIKGDLGEVIVKPRGNLILDAGAEIQLDHKESKIRIWGNLIVNGEFSFSGLGCFQFEQGNSLTLGNGNTTFKLVGQSRNNRFIRIEPFAELVLKSGDGIDLRNGTVETHGVLRLLDANRANFINLVFDGMNEDEIIRAASPTSFRMDLSEVKNCYECIGIENVKATHFLNTKFKDYYFRAIWLNNTNSGSTNFVNVDFDALPNFSSNAVDADGVRLLSFRNCELKNNLSGQLGNDPTTKSAAINLANVHWCNLKNSKILDSDIGILNYDEEKPSQIYMYECSEIKNCQWGIFSNGQNFDGSPLPITGNVGMVLMDGAKLLNNKTGIEGRNILLQLEASIGEGCYTNNEFIKPYHPAPTFFKFFKICYDGTPSLISMQFNFWGEYLPCGVPYGCINPIVIPTDHMDIKQSFCFSTVSVDADFQMPLEYSNCGPIIDCWYGYLTQVQDRNPEEKSGYGNCSYGLEIINVENRFREAYFAFLSEDYDSAEILFQPLADLAHSENFQEPSDCRKLTRIARAMTLQGTEVNDREAPMPVKSPSPFSILPNPAHDFVEIKGLLPQAFEYRLINSLGSTIKQGTQIVPKILIGEINSGFYWVEITQSNERKTVPLLIIR